MAKTPLLLGAAAVAGLLWAEFRASRRGRWIFKTLASLMFVLAGWERLGGEVYGRLIFAGLVLGFIGDIFLIPDDKTCFLIGLVSFLLGHVLFAAAFGLRSTGLSISATLAVGMAGAAALAWLWPRLGAMKPPVAAYVIVISAMAAAAWSAFFSGAQGRLQIALGATLFYFSDLSVAKNEFAGKSFTNKAWGLPFYYAGQFLIALSI